MSRDKQIEEMAKDIAEATRLASQRLVEETKALVKENHRYHSKNDFDKAHEKTMSELEAEYLTAKGYRKGSERDREIFEKIENNIKYNISLIEAMIFESEEIREAKLQCYRDFLGYLAELKKKFNTI